MNDVQLKFFTIEKTANRKISGNRYSQQFQKGISRSVDCNAKRQCKKIRTGKNARKPDIRFSQTVYQSPHISVSF